MPKTDNSNLSAKLDLRRALLKTIKGPLRVVDCFSGNEEIWRRLRKEFKVESYLALDKKKKRWRIALDSLRFLSSKGWAANVVDLDSYGSPWEHWMKVLEHGFVGACFLTVGSTMFHCQNEKALASIGITFKIPIGLHAGVEDLVTDSMLGLCYKFDRKPSRTLEAISPKTNARYFGIMLETVDGQAKS